mmetsp:Transcript_25986/g.66887  ORF Transcript_25986/g.66887 Transcript_25986/m.66887 type:complete len:361 (-) Transcript_25986:90-1172(-)
MSARYSACGAAMLLLALMSMLLPGAGAVGEANVAITTPAGEFTPQTPVTVEVGVSKTVADIVEDLKMDQFTAAREHYEGSVTLKSLAQGTGLSGPTFTQAREFYNNNADFNHRYLMEEAFVATGGNAEVAEMVEKTVMDAVPVQAILSYAYAGRNGDRASWDKACALYIGQPDLMSAPYARAQKRAANYGTLSGEVALANVAAVEACASGPSEANYMVLQKVIKIIYAQASIRYAHLLDIDFREGLSTVDHRAEGQAFYRIIAPMVDAASPSCHAVMNELYSFDQEPDTNKKYYCEALACIPDALDLTSSDLGTLENTEGWCDGVEPVGAGPSSASAGIKTAVFSVTALVLSGLAMVVLL